MRQTVDERQQAILQLVAEHGTLRIRQLARDLGVSAVTLRRDVEILASLGRLERAHGSVSLAGESPPRPEPGAEAGLTLGMVVPQAPHYFGPIIEGVRQEVAAVGGRLVLGISGYDVDRGISQVQRMLAAGAAGVLLTPSEPPGTAGQDIDPRDFDVPLVLVERRAAVGSRASALDSVRSDHRSGAALGVRHLIELGHHRVALVAPTSPTAVHVEAGYQDALRLFDLPYPELDTVGLYEGAPCPAALEAAADRLAEAVSRRQVSAVLVVNDSDALMLLEALRTRHPPIRVPQDLALVAYDDEVAALSDLPLTAIAPPKRQVGRAAARLLIQRVEERAAGRDLAAGQHLGLLPELRVRQSSGAPLD